MTADGHSMAFRYYLSDHDVRLVLGRAHSHTQLHIQTKTTYPLRSLRGRWLLGHLPDLRCANESVAIARPRVTASLKSPRHALSTTVDMPKGQITSKAVTNNHAKEPSLSKAVTNNHSHLHKGPDNGELAAKRQAPPEHARIAQTPRPCAPSPTFSTRTASTCGRR